MAFEAVRLDEIETAIVEVVLEFGDLIGPDEPPYAIFDGYLMFDDYYLVFIDDEAVIATLKPSQLLAGKFELDSEIISLQASDAVNDLISFAEQMSAADLIRLVDLYGVQS